MIYILYNVLADSLSIAQCVTTVEAVQKEKK